MTIRGARGPNAPLFDDQARHYDAVLVVSFGGPEGPDDVLPFLASVTRGRNVPRARLEEVALHYARFGGVSPLNSPNRALITALCAERARDVHGAQNALYDAAHGGLRAAARGGGAARGAGEGHADVQSRLPEPQRAAAGSVARPRHPRAPAGGRGHRGERRRGAPAGIHLGSLGGAVRPRR